MCKIKDLQLFLTPWDEVKIEGLNPEGTRRERNNGEHFVHLFRDLDPQMVPHLQFTYLDNRMFSICSLMMLSDCSDRLDPDICPNLVPNG